MAPGRGMLLDLVLPPGPAILKRKPLFLDLSKKRRCSGRPSYCSRGLCWSAREQLLQEVSTLPATDFPEDLSL